ncbi:cobalamin B12-binding domain-containing protein [Peloplasma aerotolerans]|uniref:Cobalamin-dependent protein n=1 Tax=Peloplasma aerotolerans TaxID=3044389 RepID=A0AAW6U6Z2_9MOLU|nr:cobalamin-dependent protein [Mariniplasma sp. M4Ah]MDI6452324.1 cobalamin-dependent protein [Mariniplasma sp. M4Ah]MDR4968889.1 cobalamin-dependent protein [Acholeplasmataceae bacterium]
MGLLFHQLTSQFSRVADVVYKKHFEVDQKLESEYDEYRKRKMYEDILHNLSFLQVAYQLDDEKVFKDYALWLIQLMVSLMPELTPARIKEHMYLHYQLLADTLKDVLEPSDFVNVKKHLDNALIITRDVTFDNLDSTFDKGKYGVIRKTYLDYLLNHDSKSAVLYMTSIADLGYSIEEIYVDVLQEVMKEIGEMWHQCKISVDQEHYMTSITQVVLSQFYTKIFDTDKNGLKILACSVGSELHEIGGRMISDLFEYHGWDSTYLGASVPKASILKSIKIHQPDLIALSVTMPQHLIECKDIVVAIKKDYPKLKIAVGGRAFQMTNQVWKKWAVDISTNDANSLIKWADQTFRGKT